MEEQALSDVQIIELCSYITGPYCCKLFADYGADVIKVERPLVGDGARMLAPFAGDDQHPEKSGVFLNLNTNKRGITLNLKHDRGRRILLELVKSADAVVESFRPGVMDRLGMGYGELEKINPRLVMTSISNFGQDGPYRNFTMSELTINAVSGFMASCGLPEREPLKRGENAEQYQAGLTAFVATMGALFVSRFQGQGQHVDVSIMETMLGSVDNGARDKLCYLYSGDILQRHDPTETAMFIMPECILPCKDGYVQWRASATWWPRYLDMLSGGDQGKRRDLEERFPDLYDMSKLEESWAVCIEWSMERTKQELMEEAQRYRVPCMKVSTPQDLLEDRHFRAIDYFIELEHPIAGRFEYPGVPVKLKGCPAQVTMPAPLMGQHNKEVLGELGYSRADVLALKEDGAI